VIKRVGAASARWVEVILRGLTADKIEVKQRRITGKGGKGVLTFLFTREKGKVFINSLKWEI